MISNNLLSRSDQKGSAPLQIQESRSSKIDSITAWLRQVEVSSSTGAMEDLATLNQLGKIKLPLRSEGVNLGEEVVVKIIEVQQRCLSRQYDRDLAPHVKDILKVIRPGSVSPVDDGL